ncbi:MAG TPA: hypothetical protein VL371_25390 [Gemmataceae bacterium]|nr:hypothetical protein [Gemmataceae bacterium]
MRVPSRTAGRVAAVFLATSAMLIGLAGSASAQQVQGGATIPVVSAFIRGVDTAAAPNGTYMVVGGQGPMYAVCVNGAGGAISGAMQINATPGGYASFPRAVWSQDLAGGAGGFMVIWTEAVGNADAMRQLFARVVTCSGGMSAPVAVSPTVWWEPGDLAIAYSILSKNFLVVWQTPEHTVKAGIINLAGVPIAGPVLLSSGLGRDPSVTYNYVSNEYGVAFSGETYSAFVAVPSWNLGAFRRNTFNVSGGMLTTMTDVAYNGGTGRYVMAWYELSSGNFAKIAEFDPSGALLTTGIASARLGSYDAFSMAFNTVSRTFLLVGVDRAADTVLGLELTSRGYPFNGENTLSGVKPARYPRVSSSAVGRSWNVAFSGPNFAALSNLVATGFASEGGPAGAFPAVGQPAPPPASGPTPTSTPGACPGNVPGMHCVNGNWVLNTPTTPPPTPPPTTPPPTTTAACKGAPPVSNWVCVGTSWVPPDHPLAAGGVPASQVPYNDGTCSGASPVAGWVCIRGGWLPRNHPIAIATLGS